MSQNIKALEDSKNQATIPNNVQLILNEHALTQRQLSIASGLSKGCVGKTCRQVIMPKDKSKTVMVAALNELLKSRSISKTYTREEVFG